MRLPLLFKWMTTSKARRHPRALFCLLKQKFFVSKPQKSTKILDAKHQEGALLSQVHDNELCSLSCTCFIFDTNVSVSG